MIFGNLWKCSLIPRRRSSNLVCPCYYYLRRLLQTGHLRLVPGASGQAKAPRRSETIVVQFLTINVLFSHKLSEKNIFFPTCCAPRPVNVCGCASVVGDDGGGVGGVGQVLEWEEAGATRAGEAGCLRRTNVRIWETLMGNAYTSVHLFVSKRQKYGQNCRSKS